MKINIDIKELVRVILTHSQEEKENAGKEIIGLFNTVVEKHNLDVDFIKEICAENKIAKKKFNYMLDQYNILINILTRDKEKRINIRTELHEKLKKEFGEI